MLTDVITDILAPEIRYAIVCGLKTGVSIVNDSVCFQRLQSFLVEVSDGKKKIEDWLTKHGFKVIWIMDAQDEWKLVCLTIKWTMEDDSDLESLTIMWKNKNKNKKKKKDKKKGKKKKKEKKK